MRKVLMLLSFMSASLFGYSDTLDYYNVYLNDSLIGEYNSFSGKPSIVLKQSELQSGDVLTVRYGTDHPCIDCVYVLNVVVDVKEKTPGAETTENFGKLSILIRDLVDFRKKYEIDKFHFTHHARLKDSQHDNRIYLFELRIV